MGLIEQIQKLREFGLNESDNVLTTLLSKVNYNLDRAIDYYFEHGLEGFLAAKSNQAKGKISSHFQGNSESVLKEYKNMPDNPSKSTCLFIGRRTVNGYTLSKGYGLRDYSLFLELDKKISDPLSLTTAAVSSSISSSVKPIFGTVFDIDGSSQSKKKGKDKFSAAKLLFRCYSSMDSGGRYVQLKVLFITVNRQF